MLSRSSPLQTLAKRRFKVHVGARPLDCSHQSIQLISASKDNDNEKPAVNSDNTCTMVSHLSVRAPCPLPLAGMGQLQPYAVELHLGARRIPKLADDSCAASFPLDTMSNYIQTTKEASTMLSIA